MWGSAGSAWGATGSHIAAIVVPQTGLGVGDGDLVLVADLDRSDDHRIPIVVEHQFGAAGVHLEHLAVEVGDRAARGTEAPGVGLLRPSELVDQLLDELVRFTHVARAVLGLGGGDVANEAGVGRGDLRRAAERVRDDDEAPVGVDHDHAARVE